MQTETASPWMLKRYHNNRAELLGGVSQLKVEVVRPPRDHVVTQLAIEGATADQIMCTLCEMGYRGVDLQLPSTHQIRQHTKTMMQSRDELLRSNVVHGNG